MRGCDRAKEEPRACATMRRADALHFAFMKKNPPSVHPALLPMLSYENATEAIAWYVTALGAVESSRLTSPDGKIGYSELRIGEARVAVSDVWPGFNRTPAELGGTPVVLNLYVENVDALFAQAIAAGGKELIAVQDQFYGDRCGRLQDPFGYIWILSTRVEEVSVEEMQKRFDAMCAS